MPAGWVTTWNLISGFAQEKACCLLLTSDVNSQLSEGSSWAASLPVPDGGGRVPAPSPAALLSRSLKDSSSASTWSAGPEFGHTGSPLLHCLQVHLLQASWQQTFLGLKLVQLLSQLLHLAMLQLGLLLLPLAKPVQASMGLPWQLCDRHGTQAGQWLRPALHAVGATCA